MSKHLKIKFIHFINENTTVTYNNKDVSIGDTYTESDIYSYINKLHRNEEDFFDGDIGDRIEMFSTYQVAEIPINRISIDEYQLDDDYVDEYVEMYKRLGTYPPIVLGYLDDFDNKYNIIDGTHRANALNTSGLKSIICFIGLNKRQPIVK